jgi:hypothetical protein
MVACLRSVLASGELSDTQAARDKLGALETNLKRILDEHAGMAEELLRVYEQLGVVFDLTHRLAAVRDEDKVGELLVESLRATYPDMWVEAIWPDADGALTECSNHIALHPWVFDALGACREERRVVVADCPDCRRQNGCTVCPMGEEGHDPLHPRFARALCGPIYAGDSLVCALLLGQVHLLNPNTQIRSFEASDMLLLDSLNVFCGDMIRNFRLLQEVRQLSVDAVRALISAVEQKDEYTSGHSTRVGIYATMLGKELGLGDQAMQMLEWAALLHDVGKIGIRDEVLKKAGRLAAAEFEHIKEHPVRSSRIVRAIPQLADALSGVTHHHEHWDGTGYPDGLNGEQIPLQARIIQVADVFDALTSTRPYRKAFHWSKALSIMAEEAGKTVDPHLRVVFDGMIRRLFEKNPERFDQIAHIGRPGPLPDPVGGCGNDENTERSAPHPVPEATTRAKGET